MAQNNELLFETERLVIRRLKDTDASDLFEYFGDPSITKYMMFPAYKSVKDAAAYIKDMKKVYKAYDSGSRLDKMKTEMLIKERLLPVADFAIELKSERKTIGSIWFRAYKPAAGGILELGYALNVKYQRKGYMTEAVLAMFRYIKQNKIAMRIEAKFDPENTASERVMQRTGMTMEGCHRKSGDNNKNNRGDRVYYSILYEEIK